MLPQAASALPHRLPARLGGGVPWRQFNRRPALGVGKRDMGIRDILGGNLSRELRLAMLYLMLSNGALCTAAALASGLGTGLRTVYRDIERLRAAGLDIEGTSHEGYRLAAKPELTPLFLTRAERSALAAVAPTGLKARLRKL